MNGWVKLSFLLLATFARASATGGTYTVPVPAGSHIEAPAVTQLGDWEVEISFDAELCRVSCAYRLRSDRFGRTPAGDFLLPPAVSIQVYSDAANLPSLVVIDPGGLSRPTAAAKAVRIVDESALSGRRLLLQLSAAFTTRLESAAPPAAPAGPPSGTSSFPPLALRI